MSILGMGPLEVLLVLLLAFILLGPQRMVDAARMLGKASREMRRLADELPSFSLDEEPARPIVHREGGPARGQSSSPQKPEEESEPKDVPVAFGPVEAKAEAERKPDEDEQP